MSLHVTFQAKAQPDFQGTIVTPSTCFPSDQKRPGGSRMVGMSMDARDVFTRWLRAICLRCRPALLLQCNPWVPDASIWPPHRVHWCGVHNGDPGRKPTTILTVSSSIWRPRDDTGGAESQAPDSFLIDASRRPLEASSAKERREVTADSMSGASQARCFVALQPDGLFCVVLRPQGKSFCSEGANCICKCWWQNPPRQGSRTSS